MNYELLATGNRQPSSTSVENPVSSIERTKRLDYAKQTQFAECSNKYKCGNNKVL